MFVSTSSLISCDVFGLKAAAREPDEALAKLTEVHCFDEVHHASDDTDASIETELTSSRPTLIALAWLGRGGGEERR
jgi:hypothetical protein